MCFSLDRLQELLEVRKTELSHTLKQGTNGVRPGSEAVVIAVRFGVHFHA